MERPRKDALLGHHGADLAAVEHVQQQRLDHVVAVVGQGDLVAAPLRGDLEDAPAPEPRAQEAGVLAVDFAVRHGTDVGAVDDGFAADLPQVGLQPIRVPAAALEAEIDVHGRDRVVAGDDVLGGPQQVQQDHAVRPPRDPDEDPVSRLDHAVLFRDGLEPLVEVIVEPGSLLPVRLPVVHRIDPCPASAFPQSYTTSRGRSKPQSGAVRLAKCRGLR